MYFIIGGDGKQYGPISERDIRTWIAEGRLNQQSQARTEDETAFRPLATFPELADAFGLPASASAPGAPPLSGASVGTRQGALDKVRVPAIGLIVSASLSFLSSAIDLIKTLFFAPTSQEISDQVQKISSMMGQITGQPSNPQTNDLMIKLMHIFYGPVGIVSYLFLVVIAILIFIGALKMLKLQSYEFAHAAAIIAVVPCITPCCGWILGLIFGIWAMSVLRKPEVKSQFT